MKWFLAAALFFVVLISWSLTTPVGGYPDDSFHFANIWCDEGIGKFTCEPLEYSKSRLVPNVFTDGSPWWELTGRAENLQQPEDIYPSLYYRVMRPLAGDNVVSSALLMRILNIVISTVLTVGALLLLTPRARASLLVSWVVVGPALGFYYLSSNHPSAWLLAGAGTFWAFLVGLLEARSIAVRVLSLVGLATAGLIAVGARPEGQIAIAVSGLVGLGAWITDNRELLLRNRIGVASTRMKAVVGLGGVLALLGLGSMLTRSSVINSLALDTLRERFSSGLLSKLLEAPYLYVYVVGSNARISEQGTLGMQTAPLVAAAVAVIAAGMGAMWFTKRLLVLIVGVACLLAPFAIKVGDATLLQTPPRYLVVFLLLFVVAATVQNQSWNPSQMRNALRFASPLLVLGHSLALHSALRPYQLDVPPPWQVALNGGLKWWWPVGPSPQTVWLLGSLSFAGLVVATCKYLFPGREVTTP